MSHSSLSPREVGIEAVLVATLAVVGVVRGKDDTFFARVVAEDAGFTLDHIIEGVLRPLAIGQGEVLLKHWHDVTATVPPVGREGGVPEGVAHGQRHPLEGSMLGAHLIV